MNYSNSQAKEVARGRRGWPFSWIATGLSILLAVSVLVGALFYLKYIAYTRVAARHIPLDMAFAMRLDVEKVVLFEPVRKHLLPIFDLHGVTGLRRDRLQDRTGIVLARDIRELVYASSADSAQWVLVVGGKFPRSGVVQALGTLFREDGIPVVVDPAGVSLTFGALHLGQAADGTVILASSSEYLAAALEETNTYRLLGLASDGPGGFVALDTVLAILSRSPATWLLPNLRRMSDLEKANGQLSLRSGVQLQLELMLKPGIAPEPIAQELSVALRSLRGLPVLGPCATSMRSLGQSSIFVAAPSQLQAQILWTNEELDQCFGSIAELLQGYINSRP